MNNFKDTLSLLEGLKLNGIIEKLEEEIDESENKKISYLCFLRNLLKNEVNYRNNRKLLRNLSSAHFPNVKKIKTIEKYDFSLIKGITRTDITSLMDFRWLDNRENILFFGPPGIGKTHLAIGFGYSAIQEGYSVCFERVTNLINLLKTSEIHRKSKFRINRILKSDLVIIDEIGYTPIERKEANLFFNLISELYEKSSIIITSNKEFNSWAEMMGDKIMTVAMLDRLLHHAKLFNLNGESYRLKKRKEK